MKLRRGHLAVLCAGVAFAGTAFEGAAFAGTAFEGTAFAGTALEGTGPSQHDDPAARWARMDAEQRAEFERRHAIFRALDAEQRDALRDRAREVREERRRLAERLTADERATLDGLDPERRDAVLRQHQVELARVRGERLRELVPAPIVDELESAPPEARPHLLRRWRAGFHERHLGRALRRSAEELGIDGGALERLLAAPPEEQRDTLRAWSERLGEDGPPWSRRPPGPPLLGELPAVFVAIPDLIEELRVLAEPTVGDALAAAAVEERERKRFVGERIRVRVLEHLARSGRIGAEDLEKLRTMDARDLLRGLRSSRRGGGVRGGDRWRGPHRGAAEGPGAERPPPPGGRDRWGPERWNPKGWDPATWGPEARDRDEWRPKWWRDERERPRR